MYFVKPKNLKVLTSFLPFSGQVYSQLPPMSMHFKHDSSSLIASIWKSGTCFSCPFFDILTQSLPKKTKIFFQTSIKFSWHIDIFEIISFRMCKNQYTKSLLQFLVLLFCKSQQNRLRYLMTKSDRHWFAKKEKNFC